MINLSRAISAHRARMRGDAPERGETLVELMVAVLIMGTAVVAIVVALGQATATSVQQRRAVRASNEAQTVAELIQNAPYVDCAGASPYASAWSAPNYTVPTGYTLDVAKPRYLLNKAAQNPEFQGGCPATDQGLQQIKVTVQPVSPRNAPREEVVIVKRRP